MRDNPQELTASQLEGQRWATKVFALSLQDYELGVRMRKHFHIGPRGWTLIVRDAATADGISGV
jgi:hypothetical protein